MAAHAAFQSPPPEIVSAWKLNGENAVLVFRYDGSYYLVDANPGSEGLERGTFTWDKASGAFTVNTIVDTNDDGGLSHPIGATTVAVSGDTLSYTVAGEGTFTFSRVVNTSSAIVGSWVIPGAKISVTFLVDNTYYLSEEADDPPYAVTGIEKGTYSWNSTTKVLTATPAIDTNGYASVDGTWNVSGNTLTYDDGEDITGMFRITTSSTPFNLPDFCTVRFANYEQTSDSAPALSIYNPDFDESPYSADVFVSSSVGATAPTLKIGTGTPFAIDEDEWVAGEFDSEFLFATLSALNTFMPNSSVLQFKEGAGVANLTSSATGTFPTTPKILLRGGAQWDAGTYVFGDDEVLQWTLPVGFSASQYLTIIEIYDSVLDEDILVAEIQGDVTHFDLSGFLEPDREYEVELEFYRIDGSTTAGTGVFAGKNGSSVSASSTLFLVRSDSPQAAVEIVSVGKEMLYVQTGPSTVILDPAPISPTNGGPYGFSANVEGQNLVNLTAPTVTPPVGTPSTQNDPFYGTLFYNSEDMEWRYGPNANDWGDTSQAAIDARFPNGTYTFLVDGVSIPLSLTGNAYPNIPQLTLSGGTWVNGKYAMDASSALTVTTNVFTGYGSNVDGHIYLGVNDTGVEYFRSSHPANNFATLTIPANTLPTDQVANVEADFSAIVHKSTALPGCLSVAVYGRYLELEIHILPKITSQSSSQVLAAGASTTLQVTATGSPATTSGQLNYQWKKNGTDLPGETSDSLALSGFALADAATYTCTVSNDVGSATSDPIHLEFADAYQSFVSSYSLNSVTSGAPDEDGDNDGLDTLIEFILGGSPTLADFNLVPPPTTTPTQAGRNLVFSYDRKTVANGITQWVETSPSMTGIWTPAVHGQNGVVISIVNLDANTQRVTATVPTSEPRLFVRFRASR